jgi:hypothetical protein
MNGKINNLCQIAYLKRYTLNDGTENGLKVLEVFNGKLRFCLNESKALDIMQLWYGNDNISFISKNGFTAREITFLKRFEGGLLYTCGLDNIGAQVDGVEQHGTFHNTPAKIIKAVCTEKEIEVVGEIHISSLFGWNLTITRTIKTEVGSETFTLVDEMVNNAYAPANYSVLYHVNLGYPMLDEGAKIEMDGEGIGIGEYAKKRADDRFIFTGNVDNEDERCYSIRNNTPIVKVTNDKIGKKFTLEYSKDTLPCLTQWSSAASGDYALGIEPCSAELSKETFTQRVINAGETKKFSLKISVNQI